MLNQLIRHKCLPVAFPSPSRGGTLPAARRGGCGALASRGGTPLHPCSGCAGTFWALNLISRRFPWRRAVPEVGQGFGTGSGAAPLGAGVGFAGREWRFCCLLQGRAGNRCLVWEMLSAPGIEWRWQGRVRSGGAKRTKSRSSL